MSKKVWRVEVRTFLSEIGETQGNLAMTAGIPRESLNRYLAERRIADEATRRIVNEAMADLSGLPALGRYLEIVSRIERHTYWSEEICDFWSVVDTVIHDILEVLADVIEGGLTQDDFSSWLIKVGKWDQAKAERFIHEVLTFYRQTITLRVSGKVPKENEIDALFAIFKREGLNLTAKLKKSDLAIMRSGQKCGHVIRHALRTVAEEYESVKTRMTEAQKIAMAIGDLISQIEEVWKERVKQERLASISATLAMFEKLNKQEISNEVKGKLLGQVVKLARKEIVVKE